MLQLDANVASFYVSFTKTIQWGVVYFPYLSTQGYTLCVI